MRRRRTAIAIGLAAAAALIAPALAAAAPSVTGEFALPAGTTVGSNNELVEGPDGNIWITTEQNAIVRMKPDGSAEKFEPPGMADAATGITVGADGNLWAAQAGSVIEIPPANPNGASQTSIGGLTGGQGITSGADGNIWLAGTNALVRVPPANPSAFTLSAVALGAPKGMATGTDGLLWIADGANVVSATASSIPTLTPYPIGNSSGGAQDVAAGLDSQVAYANPVDDPQGVGLISPGGTPKKVNLENSDPFGVAFGQDRAYWIARSQANDLLRLTADGQTSTLTGFAPSGGVGPRKIATGPQNTLWVTLDTPEKVARVSGVEPPVAPPAGGGGGAGAPETRIDKRPKRKVRTSKRKAKVKFKFSSPTAGATFECAATRKGKRPKPRTCRSPKSYKLKPGRYVFQAQAFAAGVADASPATEKFRIVAKK